MIAYLQQFLDMILHIDVYLNTFINTYGFWTYWILFAVIFCETGLIVTPFLPGDSLLFAAGSLAAQASNHFEITLLFPLLLLASILGNQINYTVGKFIGPKIFSSEGSKLFNKKHLLETNAFYEKYGGMTLIFARFLPIIRTFAPFVAGIGQMHWLHFTFYNLIGAVLWIGGLLSLGYFFGSLPIIQDHFSVVIYGIVAISFFPVIVTLLFKRR